MSEPEPPSLQDSDVSVPALWLALVAAGALTAWWLAASGTAHLYDRYYRLAAVCLAVAAGCVLVAGVALLARRLAGRTAAEASAEPPSTSSD